jgi:RHS repeat-associated protein
VSSGVPSALRPLLQGEERCGVLTPEQWGLTLALEPAMAAQVASEAKVIPYRFVLEDLIAAVQLHESRAGVRPPGAEPKAEPSQVARRVAPAGVSANPFGFAGHEIDRETGLIYMKGRYYDPETGRFISADPAVGDPLVPPTLHPYLYANANPTFYVDPDGEFAESVWDAISLGVGAGSLGYNLYKGNWRDAGIDALGVIADGAALALPFVPGGAGAAIKAARAGTAAAEQVNLARRTTRAVDALQAADHAVNTVDTGLRVGDSLEQGHYGEAAFNAGLAALNARGAVANTRAVAADRYFEQLPRPRGPPSGLTIARESGSAPGVDFGPVYRGGGAQTGYAPGERLPDGRIAGAGPGAALRDGPEFADTAVSRFVEINTPWRRRVYQRADIDWDMVRPRGSRAEGMSNWQAARKGYAPVRLNPDSGKWEDVILHHANQDPRGPAVELWRSTHGRVPHRMDPPGPWRKERPDWAKAWQNEQSAYWRWRTGAYDPPPTTRLLLPGDEP